MARSVIRALLLGSALAAAASAAEPVDLVQQAFATYFRPLAANETARAELLEHLSTVLQLGALKPGEKLQHVHEYDDKAALNIGTKLVPALTAGGVDAWVDQVTDAVTALAEPHTYSLVRRLVVAALLKLWLEQGQRLPGATPEKLNSLMNKLYERHRLGSVRKGVMEFLHVSKSGGTSWCHIAELNGCNTQRYDRSYVCFIQRFDDKVRWLNMTFHAQQVPAYRVPRYVMRRFSRFGTYRRNQKVAACPSRHQYVHRHDWNYYSNEYTVHGGHMGPTEAHMCKDFFNAILIRDPRKRLVSHMKFVMWTMSGDRGYNDTALFNMMYANRTSQFWQDLGPAIVDNYFVRSLLGEEAFHLPVGGVTGDHLALAEQLLAQLDLVMVLEQDVTVRNSILYYGVGWKHTLEEVHDKDSSQRDAIFDPTPYIPKDLDWLLDKQQVDGKLYAFAKTLAALDPVVYFVANASGLVPLPEIQKASATDPLHCGLLRGRNGTKVLETLGAGGTGRQRSLLGMGRALHGASRAAGAGRVNVGLEMEGGRVRDGNGRLKGERASSG